MRAPSPRLRPRLFLSFSPSPLARILASEASLLAAISAARARALSCMPAIAAVAIRNAMSSKKKPNNPPITIGAKVASLPRLASTFGSLLVNSGAVGASGGLGGGEGGKGGGSGGLGGCGGGLGGLTTSGGGGAGGGGGLVTFQGTHGAEIDSTGGV